MAHKILITGPPRCGKSTLIKKLVEYLYKTRSFNIQGFLTPEVREHNKRIGFDVEDIHFGNRFPLARIGHYNTRNKLGKYSIFTEKLDLYLSTSVKINEKFSNIFIIDEIGKMELFSKNFEEFIKILFLSDFNIIATIGQKLNHPIKDFVTKLPNLHIFVLNQENQMDVLKRIISLFY
jgi:nucleoside-triphosphatase